MNSILSLLAKILVVVLKAASPALVKELKAFVVQFKEKAAATPNPWDDVLAESLGTILGI